MTMMLQRVWKREKVLDIQPDELSWQSGFRHLLRSPTAFIMNEQEIDGQVKEKRRRRRKRNWRLEMKEDKEREKREKKRRKKRKEMRQCSVYYTGLGGEINSTSANFSRLERFRTHLLLSLSLMWFPIFPFLVVGFFLETNFSFYFYFLFSTEKEKKILFSLAAVKYCVPKLHRMVLLEL